MADAVLYTNAYNDLLDITGGAPMYTQAVLDHYRDQDDPILYPNPNWFDEIIKPISAQHKYGVSINGGRGKVSGVVIGFLMMSVITYFIGLLPGLSVWQDAIKGAIIIIAVLINVFTVRSAEKAALKERGALI